MLDRERREREMKRPKQSALRAGIRGDLSCCDGRLGGSGEEGA